MSDHTQLPQDQVAAYLAGLRQALAGLPPDDVEEVVREIGGHIAERAAYPDLGKNKMPIEQILSFLRWMLRFAPRTPRRAASVA